MLSADVQPAASSGEHVFRYQWLNPGSNVEALEGLGNLVVELILELQMRRCDRGD
jgi:hypothetical protein